MSYPPQPGRDQPGNQPPGMPGQPPPGQYGPGQYWPGQYGPGQYGPPPRKSRTGLIVAVVAALVLLAIGGVVILVTAGDDSSTTAGDPNAPNTAANPESSQPSPQDSATPGGTPGGDGNQVAQVRTVATAYVKAVNSVDEAAATRLTCKKTDPGSLYKVGTAGGEPEKYRIGEVKVLNDNFATVDIFIVDSNADPVPLLFRNSNGWCVSV